MKRQFSTFAIAIMMAATAPAVALGRDIKGVVLGENNTPLDFVNVVLYCDSTYVAGGITDATGSFIVSTDATCDLSAKISFVGYQNYMVDVPSDGNMGVITLCLLPCSLARSW